MKPVDTVLLESLFVGAFLIAIYKVVEKVLKDYMNVSSTYLTLPFMLFVSGFVFHIICEITGINVWYAKEYSKILNK